MNQQSATRALLLCAALFAAAPSLTHAAGTSALALGAGRRSNGDIVYILAAGNPTQPDHATGVVAVYSAAGALRMEGLVQCLAVTGHRALVKGTVFQPALLAGATFVFGALDNGGGAPGSVPDEVGGRIVSHDASCPGSTVAATEPLLQGDMFVFSPVPQNQPPVADAGPDQSVTVGSSVTLDGSGSTDADGDPLTFAWSLVSRPAGSSAALSSSSAVRPTMVIDRPGTYVARLVVNDGTVDSAPDTVTIVTVNSPPVANAGPDQTALVASTVTLDGSASSDVDGDPLTYAWSFLSRPSDSSATLSDPAAARPTFVVDRPGDYVVQLVVSDGTVNGTADTVTISTRNSPPVANAGPDQSATVGSTVTLDASASSDVDGDRLAFSWSFDSRPAGSGATLSDPTAVMPTFVVDRPGAYVVRLVVNDGTVGGAPDTVAISTINSAPVANAGPDQTAFVGSTVTLDGSASSDVDGDPLTFAWSLVSTPEGSGATLSDPAAARPTFAIDRPGTYVAQLAVNDGMVSGAPDTVTVSTLNSPPVANAGPDQTALVGSTVTLDGSGSSDVDGDALNLAWSFVSRPAGSSASLSDRAAVMPTFVVDRPGTYVVELIASDGTVAGAPDTVTISTLNSAPVANAGPDQTALVGATVLLDGTASCDVDGDTLTFAWALVSRPPGSNAALSDPAAARPMFVVDRPGSYVAQLIVNDGTVNGTPDTVAISTLNSAPVANAGPDQTAFVGSTVTLDGNLSSDGDGDALTFAWSFVSRPAGSSAALSNPSAAVPAFVVDRPGQYVVQLVVNDGSVNSAPDTVAVSTLNSAPAAHAGPDQTVGVGSTVTLDGGASSDADGDPLTFAWSLVSRPTGSAAALSDPTAARPTFVLDRPGLYVAQLIVNDGTVSSAPDTVAVSSLNAPPVAQAGPDQSAAVGSTVTLDGSASSDADGDPLTYAWSLVSRPAGSAAILSNTSAVMPTLELDRAGTYVARLVVNDGIVNSAPDTVTLSTLNSPPAADAGLDQTVFVGSTVTLDGNASHDLDGDALTFAWTLLSAPPGSAAALASPTTAMPTFVADLPGTYVAQLVVNDGAVNSAPDTVTITAIVPLMLSLLPDPLTVTQGLGADITLGLSMPAPPGGLTLTLTTDYPAIATAPATLTVPEGLTSRQVTVTGNAAGSTVLRASAPGGAGATATINVLAGAPITLASQTVGKDLEVQLNVGLGAPAPPGGLTVTVTSADPTRVLLATSATGAGSASIALAVPGGTSNPPGGFFVQALAGAGTVQVTATAPGYAPGAGTITLVPSGFAIISPGTSFSTTTLSANTGLVIAAARLNPGNLAFGAVQALRGGMAVDVPVTSSDTSVGTITTSPVPFSGGASTGNTAFHPLAAGTTVIAVGTPAGFSTPSSSQQVTATVTAPGMTLGSQTIGKDLEVQANVGLGAPAPAGGVAVTITSGDPARLLFSTTASGAGSPSLTLNVPAGATNPPSGFFVQALVDSGTVQVTATAPAFTSVVANMTLVPSGFVISSPGSAFSTTTLSPNTTVVIAAARLNPGTLAFAAIQALRGGMAVDVPVTSSDTNVGTITTSPVAFAGGASSGSTAFDPVVAGTAVITVGTPAGFATPTTSQQVTATVTAPGITLTSQTVGKDLEVQTNLSLGAPAPPGGVTVTVTSSDPARLLLSTTAAGAGNASITVTVPAGGTSPQAFYVQALADSGTAQFTATAAAFASGAATVTMVPSGFVISSPSSFSTTTLSANTTIVIAAARLSPATLAFGAIQLLRGGMAVDVPVTSSDTSVGVITVTPVSFAAGTSSGNTAFDPLAVGTAVIALGTPAGFATPSNFQQITATVTAPAITLTNQTVGKDLEVQTNVNLGAPAPPGGLAVTVASADPARVLLSTTATGAGGGSITVSVPAGSSSAPANFYVQALVDSGTLQINATAPAYTSGAATVTMTPSGFVINSPGSFTTTAGSPNQTIVIAPARLSPGTLAFAAVQALRGGISEVDVPVTSSDTNVGTITVSPVSFAGGAASGATAFDPQNAGLSVIAVGTPAGFSTPSNSRQITATVNP